jgi:hypothetical protein
MAERAEYLFRGHTDARGVPLEWLDAEPATAPGPGPNPGDPDVPGTPGELPIPARHLTKAEYDALSPRNKERVREAKNSQGKPLYEKNEAPAERGSRAADGGKE